jgi:Fe-S cluster biosynthesis and repair protein YggX
MSDIQCVRCGETRTPLERAPFRNELGERIHSQICQVCWKEWLAYQTALINHNGLDVRERDARDFLVKNLEAYLFRGGETEDIDTSKQGTIEW